MTVSTESDYRHIALLYAGREDFVHRTVPFLRAGLGAREPTLVVVSSEKIDLLRAELGADAADVDFSDMAEVGANPARIIPVWEQFVADHPGRRVLGIGEPIGPERSDDQLVESQHHERLLNLALEGCPLSLVCPYDTTALAPEVIDEAHRSHPLVAEGEQERSSAAYARANDSALFAEPLPEPPIWPHVLHFEGGALRSLREFVAAQARDAGLSPGRIDDLIVSVHELATNSVRHGGGTGTLRLWTDTERLICEIRDSGRIGNPLVDRRRPQADAQSGYGLWLTNRLCDLVQLRAGPDGNVARLHMRLG